MRHNIKQGVVVQAGLCESCEYIGLTKQNWKTEINKDDFFLGRIPEIFPDIDKWTYYGIECDPISCSKQMHKYHHNKQANFICCALNGSRKIFQSKFNMLQSYNLAPVIDLKKLLMSIPGGVDILALDIESDEIDLFRNYDFLIKPKYISMECHRKSDGKISIETANNLKGLFQKQNYVSEIRTLPHGHVELSNTLKEVN